MRISSKRSQARTAVTVLEMLVVIALLGVLGRLVFSSYLSTAEAMARLEERNIMLEEAGVFRQRLCDLFGRNALAVADGATTGMVWAPDHIVFPVVGDTDGSEVALRALGVRTVTAADGATSVPVIVARRGPWSAESADSDRDREATIMTTAPEFSGQLTLAYAERMTGLAPVWQDQLPPDGRPLLVRATIRLTSRRFPDMALDVHEVHALGAAPDAADTAQEEATP